MKEWSNPWNPFNSAKVLLWKDHLEACAREEYLPPVTVDIDPSNRCMYDCKWCNAYDMIRSSGKDMSGAHMVKLIDTLADWRDGNQWGVPNSACVSGGGEPYMNKEINTLFERMASKKMQIGIITTGFLLTDADIEVIARTARWIGFSMDACTSETYTSLKGIHNKGAFDKVVENIRKLTKRIAELDSKCDVAFKFLMSPMNATEIYGAIKLAKEIGVKDFHLRPVGWDNLTVTKGKEKLDYSQLTDVINKQIEQGMELETKDFRVYGVRHKFNPDFSKKITFSRCWAIPMLPTFGADGNVHTCFDMRGRSDLIMCKHDPDPSEIIKFWNSEAHKNLIRNIKIEDCPRCTFGVYNTIVEDVIIKDTMCRYFP